MRTDVIIQYTKHTVNLYTQHAWWETQHCRQSLTASPVELHNVKPAQF